MDSVDFRVGESTFFELIPFVSLGVGLCLLLTERVVDFLSELSNFLVLNYLEIELELSLAETLSLNDLISLDLRIIRLLTSSLDVRKVSSGLSSLDSSAASLIDLTEGVYTFWTTFSYCLILDSILASEVRLVDGPPFLTDSILFCSRPVFPPPDTIPFNFFVVLLLRSLVFDWVFAIVAAGSLSGTLLLFCAYCFAFNLLDFFFGEDDSFAFGKEFASPIFSVTVLKAFDFISAFKRLYEDFLSSFLSSTDLWRKL